MRLLLIVRLRDRVRRVEVSEGIRHVARVHAAHGWRHLGPNAWSDRECKSGGEGKETSEVGVIGLQYRGMACTVWHAAVPQSVSRRKAEQGMASNVQAVAFTDISTNPLHPPLPSWLLVPISLVSTPKSLLPPLASLETTPGPDSTSSSSDLASFPTLLTQLNSEAWRYTGPFSRWNRFKGSFPGLGIATVAFAGYLAYEAVFVKDEHGHGEIGHGSDHHGTAA